MMHLSVGQVRHKFAYDEVSGIITWEKPCHNRIKQGEIAGTVKSNSRITIRVTVDGKEKHVLAHRLAWCHFYGYWPDFVVDHKDRNPLNNSISNLRRATKQQNNFNRVARKNGTSKHKGVSLVKETGRWRVQATLNKKVHSLGTFDTEEEASIAYQTFAKLNHGEFYYEA